MSRRPRCDSPSQHAVRALVRQSKGLLGARSLSRSIAGVSRRDALHLKRQELGEIERERKASSARVVLAAPGILRGFDAVQYTARDGPVYALRAQDGAVPFTTSVHFTRSYDADAVRSALERDFDAHGAPLVLRLDRIACQREDRVRALLHERRVVSLHGPAHLARFYGQLERANRDLRVLVPREPCRTSDQTVSEIRAAIPLLNAVWRRVSLDFRTAEECWNDRANIPICRDDFWELTHELSERIGVSSPELSPTDRWRFAVEAAMKQNNLISVIAGSTR